MTNAWASIHEEGILDGVFAADQHPLVHVLKICMRVLRRRREGRHQIRDALRICVGEASSDLLQRVASVVDAYVLRDYSADIALASSAPPALAHKRPSTRKYTIVAADVSWDLL